ncbi:MAG: TonB-dependent receptor domain-containing protein [Sphingobium sp.]
MNRNVKSYRATLIASVGVILFAGAPAFAQPAQGDDAAQTPENEIVVTGSRIDRAGFDQPTPTAVIGDTELRQSSASNLQQVLNDQPQVRATVIGATTVGNTGSGTAPVDLRGLGIDRTLTLIDGRRFVGQNNLNFVPTSMVKRLEVVTGGASAAWGSGAVAGVVNIIMNTDLTGFSLGAESGISDRGDGQRYQFEGSWGTKFADGRGHFMIGAEYVEDKGLPPGSRLDRHGVRGADITVINGNVMLADDVNIPIRSHTGLILSGVLAGQTFNNDGTLRAYRGPDANGIGGADASNLYDDIYLAAPFKRLNAYSRLSYDIGGATIWADATYGKTKSNYNFFPDFTAPGDVGGGLLTVSATNPYLSQTVRNQLAAAGETSFLLSRAYRDVLNFRFASDRELKEGAIGIKGSFGGGKWQYSAHYSHGELDEYSALLNSRLAVNFDNALDAVLSGGQIVCAINADADPSNNDAACRPLNIFGEGNASADAVNYVTGTQGGYSKGTLDSLGAKLQGDLFSLWAGPVTAAVGVEARWEKMKSRLDAGATAGGFGLPVYVAPLSGGFNVKEAFAEIVVPLFDADAFKADLNGAARYSDYSTSGGIWSWKVGGTVRLFNDLLLRATRSRDIRSPNIADLYNETSINIGPQVDQDSAGRTGIPGYTSTPSQVTTFSGGNVNLKPEIGSTLTIGGSYSPSFARGLQFSVDYYDVKIDGAIATLSASDLTSACALGSQAACNQIIRDPVTQTLRTVYSNAQNIAQFATSGFDFEASYVLPMKQIAGAGPATLRFRALATYVKKLVYDNGLTRNDAAGDVGDGVSLGLPKWRGTFSASYQDDVLGFDARVRYVGGGKFNHLLNGVDGPLLANNDISARVYLDLGAQYKVTDNFTFYTKVNNVLDRKLPFSTTGSPHYDTLGRYFTVGANVKF